MIVLSTTSPTHVMAVAQELERDDHARANFFTEAESQEVCKLAGEARSLAVSLSRKVTLTLKRARPNRYGWSGFRYIQWVLVATPDSRVRLTMARVKGPANDRSFDGIQCEVEGMAPRDILWASDRQTDRVVRWDDTTRQVLQTMTLLLMAVGFSLICYH